MIRMKNKTIILSLLFVVSLFSSSFAQQKPQHPPKAPSVKERVKHSMKVINKKITLTDLHKNKTKAVFTSFFTDMDKIRVKGERPDITKVQSLEKVRDAKMKGILTEKQFNVYKGNLIEIFPRPPQRGQHPPKRR